MCEHDQHHPIREAALQSLSNECKSDCSDCGSESCKSTSETNGDQGQSEQCSCEVCAEVQAYRNSVSHDVDQATYPNIERAQQQVVADCPEAGNAGALCSSVQEAGVAGDCFGCAKAEECALKLYKRDHDGVGEKEQRKVRIPSKKGKLSL